MVPGDNIVNSHDAIWHPASEACLEFMKRFFEEKLGVAWDEGIKDYAAALDYLVKHHGVTRGYTLEPLKTEPIDSEESHNAA